jgi:hypothetical protein
MQNGNQLLRGEAQRNKPWESGEFECEKAIGTNAAALALLNQERSNSCRS